MKHQCSECGKEFYVDNLEDYMYKSTNEKNGRSAQCSYTCYDHACLRSVKRNSGHSYITEENFIKYVNRSESAMKAQGKKILHPIKINGKVKN